MCAFTAGANAAPDEQNAGNDVVVATRPQRPPLGYARPPFHVRPDATTAPRGLSPAQTRHAYGFDQVANTGAGQTIAIIDAYDDPNIEADLNTFSSQFGLPACTTAGGCFRKVGASGRTPRTDAGWSLEIALDVEWAHAIAPGAKIMLVEAASASFTDLLKAVDVAVDAGANVVSMSFGGTEFASETQYDSHFAFSQVAFLASSGDSGDGVEYPAASPYVVAVGGTTLGLNSAGAYSGETAWSGSGGGVSAVESEPTWQSSYPLPVSRARGVPDVSYDGDPNTGFAVYDSVRYQGRSGWFQVGGTSAGAPQWAGLMAIVGSTRAALGKGPLLLAPNALYAVGGANAAANYHDITAGANGTCGAQCTAAAGYDNVTGIGSPQAQNIIAALASRP